MFNYFNNNWNNSFYNCNSFGSLSDKNFGSQVGNSMIFFEIKGIFIKIDVLSVLMIWVQMEEFLR